MKEIDEAREEELSSDAKAKEKSEWLNKHGNKLIRSKSTLVICPASLIGQWEGEVQKRLKSGALSTLVYHGNNRVASGKQ